MGLAVIRHVRGGTRHAGNRLRQAHARADLAQGVVVRRHATVAADAKAQTRHAAQCTTLVGCDMLAGQVARIASARDREGLTVDAIRRQVLTRKARATVINTAARQREVRLANDQFTMDSG